MSTSIPVFPDKESSALPNHTVPVIAGLATGLGCLAIFILACFLYRRRRRIGEAGNSASTTSNAEHVAPPPPSVQHRSPARAYGVVRGRSVPGTTYHPEQPLLVDAHLQVGNAACIQEEGVTSHDREVNFLAMNRTLANRDAGEDYVLGVVAEASGSQDSMSPAMTRHMEALQMEMARLKLTVGELEAQMGGPHGPPPAYGEDVN